MKNFIFFKIIVINVCIKLLISITFLAYSIQNHFTINKHELHNSIYFLYIKVIYLLFLLKFCKVFLFIYIKKNFFLRKVNKNNNYKLIFVLKPKFVKSF
jgi:hypothetical protein